MSGYGLFFYNQGTRELEALFLRDPTPKASNECRYDHQFVLVSPCGRDCDRTKEKHFGRQQTHPLQWCHLIHIRGSRGQGTAALCILPTGYELMLSALVKCLCETIHPIKSVPGQAGCVVTTLVHEMIVASKLVICERLGKTKFPRPGSGLYSLRNVWNL